MSDNVIRPPCKVTIDTSIFRDVRRLALAATAKVHSDGRMLTADKKAVLAILAQIRKQADDVLQLELFSPAQRE